MPAHITHALAGLNCLGDYRGGEPLAGSGLRPVASRPNASAAYLLGCQGPDIFSHNRRTKPSALAYARLLHRRSYGTFCASFADLAVRGDASADLARDWLFGFATHQAVDRELHPYIVYRSYGDGAVGADGLTPSRLHAFLERILDVELYRVLERKPVSAFDTESMRIDGGVYRLSRDIAHSLARTFPGESEGKDDLAERVTNAFADSFHYYDVANPARVSMSVAPDPARTAEFRRCTLDGVALLHPERVSPDVDWLNESRSLWLDPVTGEERHESVPDLFDRAVAVARSSIGALDGFLRGEIDASALARAVGDGPLSSAGNDGHVGQVRFSEPFDLARYLRDEAKSRFDWLSSAAEVDPPVRD